MHITFKKNIFLIASICLIILMVGNSNICLATNKTDSLILVFKKEVKKKHIYDKEKENRIQKLKFKLTNDNLSSDSIQYTLNDQLLDEYISYQRDTAIVIANRLIDLGNKLQNKSKINAARIKLGKILISSGIFKEASDCLALIDIKNETNSQKYEYYHLLYWLNWALQFSIDDTYYSPTYRDKEHAYRDSAKNYANPDTFDLELLHLFPDSIFSQKDVNYPKYMKFLNEYQNIQPNRAARLAFMYNFLYANEERSNHFLLLAAIFDVRNSTKETAAILKVGENLLKQGKISDSYYFLVEGLDNANFFGSKLHKLEITNLLPQVTAQKIIQTERKIMYFIIISVLLIFILIWFIFSRTKLKSLNQKISFKNQELHKILQELEKSQRENSWIMKVLAHDLRGTITGSIHLYEIFIHNKNLSPEEKKMLELLEESNQDALKTISDLLRIKSESGNLKRESTALDKLIIESTTLLQYKANEKSQVLKTNLFSKYIPINREKMRRVFDNILSNAIKFSASGSNIFVEMIEKDENSILIKISDSGIGIPDEYKTKIFKLDPEIRREGTFGEESFGLGLYICKQILDEHNGKIWIENNLNQGTVFYIELPVA